MVNVIGKSADHVMQAVCSSCSSILEYTYSDCSTRKHTDISNCTDIIKEIQCPSCTKTIRVK